MLLAAAAVDMTDDDHLVMMAPTAPPLPAPAAAVAGKRKRDEIAAAAAETTTTTTTTTNNDDPNNVVGVSRYYPMLLGTGADELLPPPPLPLHHSHPPPATTTTTTTTEAATTITTTTAACPVISIRPSPEGQPDKPKSTRINWGKSPHKERLSTILNDWFTKSGQCIDAQSGQPIPDYRMYASKVGISRTTLFKYIHKDPSKRRLLRDDPSSGSRGKKRLISEEEVMSIVRELKDGGKE